MSTRKRKSEGDCGRVTKKNKSDEVNNIKDLINLSYSRKFFRNLDMLMLWKITPLLEQLDNLIGMDSLKESIFYQVLYYLQKMHTQNNNEYLHTVIYGAPGCGKTTVAKILGNIYKEMGILSPEGRFTIAYRDDLIAGYLGQTSIKTKKLLNSCIGGVLFIDEVYALGPKENDKDSFAKEAVDTITGFLSEHKNDFCCIIAGYEEEVNSCFFSMNRGLQRRFPWVHKINPYSSKELYEILVKMVDENNWTITADENSVIELIERNKDYFKNGGGDIETFLTRCKMMHSHRVFRLPKNVKFILIKEDLDKAINFIKKNNKIETKGPPEHMYM